MSFVHHPSPDQKPAGGDVCLVVQGDRLLARADDGEVAELPKLAAVATWAERQAAPLHVGQIDGRSCWLWTIEDKAAEPPEGWTWQETRAVIGLASAAESQAISCARQLGWWDRRHRFCGVCGTPTVTAVEERARKCPQCGAMFFPSASPAVIVAVTRGEELLLAHNRNFRPGLFSVLAGFVDPGEALEQAVRREVREEAGVELGALRYVASEPWSFPNSLMIGFRAEWESGELVVDGKEIETAGWFRRDALPETPRRGSLACALIEGWRREG